MKKTEYKSDMMQDDAIFDPQLIEHFRARAFAKQRGGEDFLLKMLVEDLTIRLTASKRHFPRAVDLHSHTNLVADCLLASGKVEHVERVETNARFLPPPYPAHISARENLDFPRQSADLITSLASLHLTNDTPGTLIQIRQILKPDGLFLACVAGTGTLKELRHSLITAESELYGGISPRIYPFLDVRDGGSLLQRAGFALPVTDTESLTVRYDSMFDLMRDLRAMGMQNALINRSRKPVSKSLFLKAAQIYADQFCDPDGRIRATFNFVWLSGWAPHPDQQKPAQRGSATASLKSFLH